MSLRRIALLAALGALVPVSAFALDGETHAGLSVSASLGECGVGETQVFCEINASWTGVPGAEYYTASVVRADGSVQDLGRVGEGEGGGATSIWVPYVGSGTYSVRISAYGTPPGEEGGGDAELLDEESSHPDHDGEGGHSDVERTGGEPGAGDAADAGGEGPAAGSEDAAEGSTGEGADPVPEGEGDGAAPLPECETGEPASETVPAPDGEVTDTGADASAVAPAAPGEPTADTAQGTDTATPAELVECPEPSTDSQGPCCPPGA